MAKRSSDRFASVKDFAAAFDGVIAGKAIKIEFPLPTPTVDLETTLLPSRPPTVIHRLPAPVPDYFLDRHAETVQLNAFVQSPYRIMTVVGRGGMGKTGLVCRFFKSLESGLLPDNGGFIALDGVIYLSWQQRTLNENALYEGLCRLLPDDLADELRAFARQPQTTLTQAYTRLLDRFRGHGVVILLDNIEEVLEVQDPNHPFREKPLFEALEIILTAPPHPIKIVMTSKWRPSALLQVQPSRQIVLDLHEGLPSPYAERYLKAMDETGGLGLQALADEDAELQLAREKTRGNPRALEAIIGILRTDDNATLASILSPLPSPSSSQGESRGEDNTTTLAYDVTAALVAEAFNRLDKPAQTVMQALAIYNRAVPLEALHHLLTDFVPETDILPILRRLVNMRFVRQLLDIYNLHPIDSAYALSRIPVEGENGFTQTDLYRKGADYYESIRKPEADWQTLDDFAPQLAEIDLRVLAGDYDSAARVLMQFDRDYLDVWGHWTLMKDLHERLYGKITEPALQSTHLGTLGLVAVNVGQLEKSITFFEQSIALARTLNDRAGEGRHLGLLATAYRQLGQTEKAIAHYEQTLLVVREIHDRKEEGQHLGNLGISYSELSQLDTAITYYQQAIAIAREIKDRRGEGRHLGNLGSAYADLGQMDTAITYYQQALAIAREMKDRRGEGIRFGNLGLAYADLGQLDTAIDYYQQALAIAREMKDRSGESYRLGYLGLAYRKLGQLDTAVTYVEQALAIAREIKDRTREGIHLGNLGFAQGKQGHFGKAVSNLQAALAIAAEVKSPIGHNYRGTMLAQVYLMQQDYAMAEKTAALARTFNVVENNHDAAGIHGLALLFVDKDQAGEAFNTSIEAANAILNKTSRLYTALYVRGLAYAAMGRYAEAEADYRLAVEICAAKGIVEDQVQRLDWVIEATGDENLGGIRALLTSPPAPSP